MQPAGSYHAAMQLCQWSVAGADVLVGCCAVLRCVTMPCTNYHHCSPPLKHQFKHMHVQRTCPFTCSHPKTYPSCTQTQTQTHPHEHHMQAHAICSTHVSTCSSHLPDMPTIQHMHPPPPTIRCRHISVEHTCPFTCSSHPPATPASSSEGNSCTRPGSSSCLYVSPSSDITDVIPADGKLKPSIK